MNDPDLAGDGEKIRRDLNGVYKISARIYVAPPELWFVFDREPRAEARGYQNAAAPQPIANGLKNDPLAAAPVT